jgi:four helix bundle protein
VRVDKFEDLRVWQVAKQQAEQIGHLTRTPDCRKDFALCDQINRASLSVMNNISEGFLRHYDPEFLQFLRYAAGSNGEVRSCLLLARSRGYLSEHDGGELIEQSNYIGRMIRRLQDTLRTSLRTKH